MRLAQALDVLVAVPRQSDLDLVLAVLRERVGDQGPAARADRQALDVLLLGDVRPDADRVAAGGPARAPDGQAADLLRRGDVAVQERRREVAHRHVVESMTGLVGRQHRRGVDVQRQQVADGVLVLGPVEPAERVGPAGIGMRGGRAIERAGDARRRPRHNPAPPAATPRRGHLPRGQLPDDLLPGLRMLGRSPFESRASRSSPAALSLPLWQPRQNCSVKRSIRSASGDADSGRAGGAGS